MEMRMRRTLVALLGILAVATFAPQLASADTSTGILSGTVTNTAQQAIAGVSVQLTDVSTGNSYFATTGSDGTYQVSGVPTDSYQVLFRPGAGQNYVYQYYPDKSNAAAAQAVSVTAGQTTPRVDATLAIAATVSGKVTDAATGAPLSGVNVYVRDYGGGYPNYVNSNSVTTDSTGTWSVVGLPTGIYQVVFNPPYQSNYASQYYNHVTGQGAPTAVALTAGSATSNIDAALTAGGQISGTVTDGTAGAPAPGIFVSALDNAGDQFASATTDAAGHYTLTGLSPSASYRVEYYPPYGSHLASEFYSGAATLAAATPVAVTMGQTTPNIDETLGEGGSLSGVVTDAATGYPIGNVEVTLTDGAGNRVAGGLGADTEPDGSYDVTNVPPGSYKVEFSAEGALGFQYYSDASTLSTARSVTVSAGQAVTNIDAALTQGGTLEGVVTDAATGQGLADSYVGVVDARGNFLTYGFADPNGRYEIHGIAPGSYYVEFFPGGNGPQTNYPPRFYGGTLGLTGATPVTISAGATTAGIDVALSAASATSPSVTATGQSATPANTTPAPPVAVVTRVIPGPPTLSNGSISGLAKGKPAVKFRLASGANGAPKLRSFKVKLPAGLGFVAAQVRTGVKVTGAGKVTEKVIGGQLIVTLGSPSRTVMVSISSPAVKVTTRLAAKAAQNRAGTLRVIVTVTPVNAAGRMLPFAVKNPS